MLTKNYNEFLNWFVGFAEGDGSFILASNPSRNKFEIWQHKKDVQVLSYVKQRLGIGRIRELKYRRNMVVYTINKQEELEKLKDIFIPRLCTENTQKRLEIMHD